jgi:hypothetical protein
MIALWRAILAAGAVLTVAGAGSAGAQENLDQGKNGAQLYAGSCALCHKTPQGLAARGGGMLGLQSFLREHYTASRESATAIAAYLEAAGNAPAVATKPAAKRPAKKGDEAAKTGEKKPEGSKAESKPAESKSSESKPSESKSSESKPAESKDSKPSDAKPAEPKASDVKSGEKPSEPKSGESKPAAAPGDKPAKSD